MDLPISHGVGGAQLPAQAPEVANGADDAAAYQVRLQNFEGPLDLLLHLIREQQIDIYDIPIALITRQYLQYLDLMKELNINVVGEFLVMAASLIYIKSSTLIPVAPPESEELDDDGEDPREELVRRLVEYQRYQSAASELHERADLQRDVFHRPADPQSSDDDGMLLSEVQLYDLIEALQRVVERLPNDVPFTITMDELSVKERMMAILDELSWCSSLDFFQLCTRQQTRAWLIVTFLAVLELLRLQLMTTQRGGSDLLLCRSEPTGERHRDDLEEVG